MFVIGMNSKVGEKYLGLGTEAGGQADDGDNKKTRHVVGSRATTWPGDHSVRNVWDARSKKCHYEEEMV
jgi:hypothetical protein